MVAKLNLLVVNCSSFFGISEGSSRQIVSHMIKSNHTEIGVEFMQNVAKFELYKLRNRAEGESLGHFIGNGGYTVTHT